MQNHEQNTSNLSYASLLFMNTSDGNQESLKQRSPLKSKRQTFSNQIRQQQRDNYRSNVRNAQLKFLQQIGINHKQDSNSELFNLIIEEEEKMQLQHFLMKKENYKDQEEDGQFHELERTFRVIDSYRQKEFTDQPSENWFRVKGRILCFLKSQELSHSQKQINCEQIHGDTELILHLLSKQIFYPNLEWRQWRIIQPTNFSLIQQYLCSVYRLLSQRNQMNNQIQEMFSVITSLLIHFYLKIESTNLSLGKGLQMIEKENMWHDQILFDQLLTVPFNYAKWALLSRSTLLEINAYSITQISQIIVQKCKYLSNYQEQSQNHNILLHQVRTLMNSCQEIFTQLTQRQLRLYNLEGNQALDRKRQILELVLQTLQITIKWIADFLCLCLQRNKIKLQQILSRVFIQLISFESSLEKVFSHILESLQDNSKSDNNSNFFGMNRQFQHKYESYFSSSRISLQKDHFVRKELHQKIFKSEKPLKNSDTKKRLIESFFCNKIRVILPFLIHIRKEQIREKLNPTNNKSQTNYEQTFYHQKQDHQLNQQLRLKVISRWLSSLCFTLQKKSLGKLLADSTQQITSIAQLEQILQSESSEEHNPTFLILFLVSQLFSCFHSACQSFKDFCKLQRKSDESQRVEATLVYQVWTISKILNIIAQNDHSNHWKYGYLLWQLQKLQSFKSSTKSIFHHIQNLYSHLTRSRCGNTKESQVKVQLATLCQNVLYYAFPLQSHFDEFDPETPERSIKVATRLAESFINSQRRIFSEKKQFISKNPLFLDQLFSSQQLDSQTDKFLQFTQKLLEETVISLVIIGIKMVTLILLTAPSQQVFNYFSNCIKSSTKIYLNIQNLHQVSEHSKVVESAEQFLEVINAGFEQEQLNNSDTDQGNSNDVQI